MKGNFKSDKAKLFKGVSLGLFIVASFLPAFEQDVFGFLALIFGAFSILFGLFSAFLAWLANVFYLLAFINKGKKRALYGTIGFLLSLFAFNVDRIPMHTGSSTSPVDVGIGAFFWIASFAALAYAGVVQVKNLKRSQYSE